MGVGIEPLASMVLIVIQQAAEQTTSGLLLPEEAREKMTVGTIVSIGPDVEHVNPGDRVIYRQYGGMELEWMGVDFLLIKEEDLQAKVIE